MEVTKWQNSLNPLNQVLVSYWILLDETGYDSLMCLNPLNQVLVSYTIFTNKYTGEDTES